MLSLATATATATSTARNDDPAVAGVAFADEIEQLARRDTEGLELRRMADGSLQVDLQGRFRQVTLGRVGDDGEMMVGCVGTLDEAQRFLGRELRSGKVLPPSMAFPAPDSVATRAARHGMTPMQLRFYESLVEKAQAPDQAKAATITIVNADGPGEGFNDATAATPEGGNSGTTRGQQRLNVFNQAAAIWGAFLDSPIPTAVTSRFDPLFCDPFFGATLGQAGPTTAQVITGGIGGSGTLFPAALANKILGNDANGATAEIETAFNSGIDSNCLGNGTRFYYGLDNATPSGTVNLLVVVLHELAHGLGSLSFTGQSGAFVGGVPDIWARFQFDRSVGLLWSQMTDAQRAASATNTNNVLWDGANVRIGSGFLTAARDASGRVELFTPNPFATGSSVSHWNSTASPNLLMEPAINAGLPLTLDLTRQQMRDIGWSRDSDNNGTPDAIFGVLPSGSTVAAGSFVSITWNNAGGFNRNVDVELSTDGGATFPTVIATNASNIGGGVPWVPPSTPTTQARIRVRESGFVEPSAVSFSNFTINTPPTIVTAAAVTRQRGSPAGAAIPVATVNDALTPAGSLTVTESVGGTATGITVAGITNSGGSVSATLAASCSASSGTVRFRASDGNLDAFGNLQVNVDNNTPPTLTYAAQSGANGGSLTVNPATGPSDNGTVSTTLLSQGTYTGTISVGAANGVVSLSNLAPTGTHTVTVRATDNCGSTVDASFQLTVTGPANTAPTFTPAAAITRQQGTPAPSLVTVGTVADAQTPAGSLFVSQVAGGTSSGVAATSVTNSNGTISASVVATCAATAGTLRFQVSDGTLSGTGDLQVNVTPNSEPTLTYAAQSGTAGASLTVNPATGPSDTGVVNTIALLSQGTYTGTISVSNATGVVSLSNLAPVGTHTITVRATDNCGATRDASFQLTVGAANTAPTFTPVAPLTRQQGEPEAAPITIGTVTDAQTPAGSLTVAFTGGTAPGVTIGGLSNANGTVTAVVRALCNAASGTLRFQVSDGTLSSTGDLQVTVLPNTPPTLTYGAQFVASGGALAVSPATGPTDNGPATTTALLNAGTYTGTVSVGASNGVVSLSNAAPIGLHTITVRATDNCGATTDAPVSVQVNGDAVFGNGFEPVAPAND